jgi:hypothetical protein
MNEMARNTKYCHELSLFGSLRAMRPGELHLSPQSAGTSGIASWQVYDAIVYDICYI